MVKPFPGLAVCNGQLHGLLGDIVNVPLSGGCGDATFRPIRGVIETPAMGRSGHMTTIAQHRKRGFAPIEKPMRDHRRRADGWRSFLLNGPGSRAQWSRTRISRTSERTPARLSRGSLFRDCRTGFRAVGRVDDRYPFVGPGLFGSDFHPIRRGCSHKTFASYQSFPARERGLEPRIAGASGANHIFTAIPNRGFNHEGIDLPTAQS